MQPRKKWQRYNVNISNGNLVSIKEPTPPQSWKTIRVIKVFPADVTVVRVAKVRMANGKILRQPVI